MSRAKVLFVESAPTRYGSTISMLTLVRSLDRSRFDPVVAAHRDNPVHEDLSAMDVATLRLDLPGSSPDRQTTPNGAGPSPAARRIARGGIGDIAREIRDRSVFRSAIGQLRETVAREQIDIIHCNNQISTNRFAYFARPPGVPLVQHVRIGPLSDASYIRKLARRADLFICISRFVERCVRESIREDAPTRVIYNPIGDEFFAPPSGDQARAASPDAPFVFCQIGRLVPWKGQDLFLRAFRQVAERLPAGAVPPRALLMGASTEGGGYERELRRMTDELGIAPLVEFRPYDRDVRATLSNIDCMVHCTRGSEGFGRVAAEALAGGIPVIASSRGALPELVEDGVSGFIADDPAQIAAAMSRLISDQSVCERMSVAARLSAERFRSDSSAQLVMGAYDELLRLPRLGAGK